MTPEGKVSPHVTLSMYMSNLGQRETDAANSLKMRCPHFRSEGSALQSILHVNLAH